MLDVKPLIDETLPDAEQVVRSRFPASAIGILHKVMRNPMRKVCAEAGDIAYEDGRPIAFQAFSGREMFFGREHVRGNVGGMTVICAGASVEAMIDIGAAARKNRIGHEMGFGNTQCAATEKMAVKAKATLGPNSCCWYRYRPVRWLNFIWYCFSRKVLKRPIPDWPDFDAFRIRDFSVRFEDGEVQRLLSFDERFDDFWSQYVATNQGLVCSRTVEELNWIFGEEVKSGQAVILGYFTRDRLDGYVILKSGSSAGRRWQIMDWIALGNDKKILDRLLAAGCRYLRKCTPAMLVESIGYPTFVQDILKRHLPFKRFAGNNFFSYGYRKHKDGDTTFKDACESVIDTEKSWFFGPYDGDMCM